MTEDTNETVLKTILDFNDHRLTLVERHGHIVFKAELAPLDDNGKWSEQEFSGQTEAIEWLDKVTKRRARASRKSYEIPVTISVGGGYSGHATFVPAILRGINATDGEWKITRTDGTKDTVARDKIFRPMSDEDREEANEIMRRMEIDRTRLREIERAHEVNLPRTYGRVHVEKAIEHDATMAERFGVDDDDDENAAA